MSLVMSPFDSLAIKCFCSLLPPADVGTLSSATMYLSVCLSVRHSVSCPSPKTVHLGHGYYETLIDYELHAESPDVQHLLIGGR